ncbi:MAG: hypothetical protein JW928_07105 [Candidatus Aureabacteria bacterium]|nr:hypothetical protein [Candidatus Auribacterota bacterium]
MQKFIYTAVFLLLVSAGSIIFIKLDKEAKRKTCYENIQRLEEAKRKFGAEYGAGLGSHITLKVLETYLGEKGKEISCPSGGEYSINPVGQPVTCSVHSFEKEVR